MEDTSSSTNPNDALERLKAAGFLDKPLPPADLDVLANLAPEEVDVLISVKERLETASSEAEVQGHRSVFL